MQKELLNKGEGVYEIDATLEKEAWTAAREKALKKLIKNVQIKGFRKGQAPESMAKNYVDPNKLINEAINIALPSMYDEAIKEFKLVPFTQPDVEVTDLTDEALKVKFIITVYPEVKLGQYKDIHLEYTEPKVSAKEVKESIDKLLADNAELVLSNEPAKLGDTVVLDFKGYIDGKEFEGGSADNYSLVLGSNSFVPGFEEQLVGVSAETKKDVLITFPEQYVKDLAGKPAKFVCMIHEVKTKVVPELNDEFVETLNIANVKTVEDLKKHQKNKLFNEKVRNAESDYLQRLINKICENSEVVIGEKVLEAEAKNTVEKTKQQVEQNGLTFEQYLQILGLTEEKLLETAKENAKHEITSQVVLGKLAEVENLYISKAELDKFYEDTAKLYNMDVAEFKKKYSEQEREIVSSLSNQKIINFLKANNGPLTEEKETKEEPTEKPAETEVKEEAPVKKTRKPRAKKAEEKPAEEAK